MTQSLNAGRKAPFSSGASAAAMGVFSASTMGAASLKWRMMTAAMSGLSAASARERGAEAPLPALDQVERGVIAGKALGRTGEGVAFEFSKGLADRRALQQLSELRMMIEEPVADGGELFFLGHIGAGRDDHFLGADVKVVAGARGLLQALVRPPRGDVGFIGALVGREARVAINPEERFLRRAHVIGREVQSWRR